MTKQRLMPAGGDPQCWRFPAECFGVWVRERADSLAAAHRDHVNKVGWLQDGLLVGVHAARWPLHSEKSGPLPQGWSPHRRHCAAATLITDPEVRKPVSQTGLAQSRWAMGQRVWSTPISVSSMGVGTAKRCVVRPRASTQLRTDPQITFCGGAEPCNVKRQTGTRRLLLQCLRSLTRHSPSMLQGGSLMGRLLQVLSLLLMNSKERGSDRFQSPFPAVDKQ